MGNSRKNKSSVFSLETFSEFSHIIKVLVNMLIPPANQTQRSISHGILLTKILNPGIAQKHSALLLL